MPAPTNNLCELRDPPSTTMGDNLVFTPKGVEFTCDEVQKLIDAYELTWSDLRLTKNGKLVFRAQGPLANRKYADAMAGDGDMGFPSCVKVLGAASEVKCDALIETVESVAVEKEDWWYYTKYIGGSIVGLIGVAVAFCGVHEYGLLRARAASAAALRSAGKGAGKLPGELKVIAIPLIIGGLVIASTSDAGASDGAVAGTEDEILPEIISTLGCLLVSPVFGCSEAY